MGTRRHKREETRMFDDIKECVITAFESGATTDDIVILLSEDGCIIFEHEFNIVNKKSIEVSDPNTVLKFMGCIVGKDEDQKTLFKIVRLDHANL